MSLTEAICWAFDLVPSRVDELLWSITYEDLQTKLRLRIGFEHTRAVQEFQSLAIIVGKVFGGGKGGSGQNPRPTQADATGPQPPRNAREAQAQWASFMQASRG